MSTKVVSVPCLYTKQKTKKRKSWIDGKLNVNSNGMCVLFDTSTQGRISAGSALDSVFLKADELRQVMAGMEIEIEMENYIVTVDSLENHATPSPSVTVSQLPRSEVPPKQEMARPYKDNTAHVVHTREVVTTGREDQPRKAQKLAAVNQESRTAHEAVSFVQMQAVLQVEPQRISQSAALKQPQAVAKPFKPPSFRPPANNDTASGASARIGVPPSSISARYQLDSSNGGETVAAANTTSNNAFNQRYAGVAGSAGNGRYMVSSDEIDDLWEGEVDEGTYPDVKVQAVGAGSCYEPSQLAAAYMSAPLPTPTTRALTEGFSGGDIWGGSSPGAAAYMSAPLPTPTTRALTEGFSGGDIWGG